MAAAGDEVDLLRGRRCGVEDHVVALHGVETVLTEKCQSVLVVEGRDRGAGWDVLGHIQRLRLKGAHGGVC